MAAETKMRSAERSFYGWPRELAEMSDEQLRAHMRGAGCSEYLALRGEQLRRGRS